MRTVKLELVLTEEQKGSLLRTMEEYTKAFDGVASWGYRNRTANKYHIHSETYRQLRSDVPDLTASLIQSATAMACEALKASKFSVIPKRKKYSGIRYTWREARVYFDSAKVSISSINGRIHAIFIQSKYSKTFSDWKIKSSVLVYQRSKRVFCLNVTVEKEDVPKRENTIVLGIDRGLKNIAVCSNNMFFVSSRINAVRGKYAKNRAELQAVGTRSAKRRLRDQAGRERRFIACENHRISKIIVNTDFTVFALENLGQISKNRWLDKRMKKRINGWAFHQLEEFIQYKAEGVGKRVILVDPTCTSQRCSECGWIAAENRHRSEFLCVKCGFHLHSDLNASRNIAHLGISEVGRLLANQPNATGDEGDSSGVQSKGQSLVASSERKADINDISPMNKRLQRKPC